MGTVAASFSRGDGASDSGKWWVDNDQLCQKWTSWMDGKSYCYKLTQNGASVQWVRNDGHSGPRASAARPAEYEGMEEPSLRRLFSFALAPVKLSPSATTSNISGRRTPA